MTPAPARPAIQSAAPNRFSAIIQTLIALLLCGALVFVLDSRWGQIPALGRLLDPSGGFWANAERQAPWAGHQELNIPGLQAPVQVVVDDRLVPHIFAQNDHDLHLAQGYLTAQMRLWQMDLQTRAAGGMLAEILGERVLNIDRDRRRVGMLAAAERAMATTQKDPETWAAIQAYAQGVNAYIASLSPKDYPFEYKLLGVAPSQWTELRTFLLLKYMAWDLSADATDWEMTHNLARLGPELMGRYYPDYPERMDPIIPAETKWDFTPIPRPSIPPTAMAVAADTSATLMGKLAGLNPPPPREGIGSNNWVLHGTRTATGLPILANDPHLQLNLPSIWMEIQLHTPEKNVYGVSLPGAPGVIIGFNEHIAWGVTNVGSDVRDWYRIRFRDESLNEYFYAGTWQPVTKRIEEIALPGGRTIRDTVRWTHHGPIVFPDTLAGKQRPIGFACRWVALDSSNDARTFLLLNRARTYDDYQAALRTYVCPAQNFVFASRDNEIALWVNGKFPLKWQGQGKYVLDGTDPRHDWQGWIPQLHNPHAKNPARGFLSSANQHSAAASYPYFMDWDQVPFERGERINQVLATFRKATPDSLLALQNDNVNILAQWVLPAINARLARLKLDGEVAAARAELARWDAVNGPGSIGATIFVNFYSTFTLNTFQDELPGPNRKAPSRDQIAELFLRDTLSPVLDDKRTPARETLDDIISRSFNEAVLKLAQEHGSLGEKWAWGTVKNTTIKYLLPGNDFARFSRSVPTIGGGSNIVNASQPRNGPSWKMIVAIGQDGPQAYGVYPGGQSGNPGSKYYDNFVDTWGAGKNYPLVFLKAPELAGALGTMELKGN